MKLRWAGLALVWVALIAACDSAARPTPTAPAQPTAMVAATSAPTTAPTIEPTVTPTIAPTLTPAPAKIEAVRFDLGDSVLVQPNLPAPFRDMPIRLEGLIAVPPTGDNLPIAVVLHGNHGTGCPTGPDGEVGTWPCPDIEKKHYLGFAYLLETLAAQGYVAVGLNVNPVYAVAYGEPNVATRMPALVDLYLEKIAAANNGNDVGLGLDLKGRIDWNRLVMLGHSQGGEGLNWVIDTREARADRTAPDQISAGQGPLTAAVYLAPPAGPFPETVSDVPMTVILPACDHDVADLSGQFYYERARQQPDRPSLAASVYLAGAYHNGFNAVLPSEAEGTGVSTCQPAALLSAAAHQEFLARYVLHFFNITLDLDDEDPAAIGLDPAQPAPSQLLDRQVLTSLALPTAQRLRLPLTTAGARGAVTITYCEAGRDLPPDKMEVCRRGQFNQPGLPEDYVITWDGANSAYEVAVPSGQTDLSGYDMLHLRAAVDPLNTLNAADQPQSLSLRLTDRAGQTATVKLDAEPALAFPAGEKGFDDYFKRDTWNNHVLLSSIRVPLSAFTGIDLSKVQSVALVFDVTDSGSILVTDLEFLKTGTQNSQETNMTQPESVTALQAAYGAPSQAAFGSAVFYEQTTSGDLEQAALAKYRYFVGKLWEQYGEAAWLDPWKQVYARPSAAKADIVAELRGIKDQAAQLSVPMILDTIEGAEQARAALSRAFDDPAVTELLVYNLGDSGAMSGLLIAARRSATGEDMFLVFLLD